MALYYNFKRLVLAGPLKLNSGVWLIFVCYAIAAPDSRGAGTATAELKRIMHIEDDESIRMITSVTLESVGNLDVLSCESGYQGLEKFAGFQPQVVLLDVMMPELDGPSTLEELKKQFDLNDVMVIFMTAKVQQEELNHFRSIGGFDVIEKPFDPMSLTDKIRASWDRFINSE